MMEWKAGPISGIDAAFLIAENLNDKDSSNNCDNGNKQTNSSGSGKDTGKRLMNISQLWFIRGRVSPAQLREKLKTWMEHVPIMRHRLSDRSVHPSWIEDKEFDVERHIEEYHLNGGIDDLHSEEELQNVVARLHNTLFDRDHPLWKLFHIRGYKSHSQGLENCDILLIVCHHVMGDGASMGYATISLLDDGLERFPLPKPPPKDRSIGPRILRMLLMIPMLLISLFFWLYWTPVLLSKTVDLITNRRKIMKNMGTDEQEVAWTRPIPLADVKTVGTLIGKATVNDVVCAVLAGALRQMIVEANDDNVKDLEGTRESGFPLEDMRWAIPFDMRMPWNRVPGNIISTLWLRLPVTAKTPQQRLSLVQQRMDSMKKSPESLVSYYLSATLGNCPPSIAQKAAPLFMEAMHGAITNVRGPPSNVAFCNLPIVRMIALIPQPGFGGYGSAILSYDGQITLSFHRDMHPNLTVDSLVQHVHWELDRLLEMARNKTRRESRKCC